MQMNQDHMCFPLGDMIKLIEDPPSEENRPSSVTVNMRLNYLMPTL